MRTTFAIAFYCRKSKMSKKGYAPIELSLTVNGKRIFLNLPRKARPEEYEKELKKKTSDLNKYLEEVRRNIDSIQTELLSQGMPITASNIREYIQNGGIKTYTVELMFADYFNLLRKRLNTDLEETTYEKYERARDEFFGYIKDKEIEADSIGPDVIANYYAYLNQKYRTSTTASKMTKIKTVWKYAFQSGKVKRFPFSTVKIRKGRPSIEYLTTEEMRRICALNPEMERIERVRDLFILQASTGLSFSDLNALTPTDIKETPDGKIWYIKKERCKTGIEYLSIILPEGVEVLKKYHMDIRPIMLSNQKYNSYLKEIADLCHIHKDITTHLGRKTYATYLLNSGINLKTVSKMLGHSNIHQTETAYAKLLDNTVIEEVKEII